MVFVKFSNFISSPPKKLKSDSTSINLRHRPLEKTDLQIGAAGPHNVFFSNLFHFTEPYNWAPISKQDNVARLPEKMICCEND